MKIYKIVTDSNNVQALNLVKHKTALDDILIFDCQSKIDGWSTLDVYIYNPKTNPQNFYQLDLGTLICDEKTVNICYDVFEIAGEILPVQVERGPKLYLINILKCINALNYEESEWAIYKDGTKGRIVKYRFHNERVKNESSIFKIPEVSKTGMFCYSDLKNPDDEFYHLYHKHKLTGLTFEEL